MRNGSGDTLDAFSLFYAVVLHHQSGAGRRVRWSPQHGAWVRSSDYARYGRDPWLDEPGEVYGKPDAPTEQDRAEAASLAHSVISPETRPFFCQRCWRSDPGSHFIAPDVYGEAELYCLQVPAYSVVASSGGSGTVKHWGSPFGCHSVKHNIDSDLGGRGPYIGPLAAYVFGHPLPADEVINREWCSRCAGSANNAHDASRQGQAEWASEQVRKHVRRLSRALTEYYGEG